MKLFLSTKLYDVPLFSIRSGGRIGTVTSPIINPHNLHIDGFYCTTPRDETPMVLVDIDVRDISTRGIIINDHQDLTDPKDLVRLKKVLELQFDLINKNAVVNNKKVGKITQFAIDIESLFIQKFYARPRGWQSFKTDSLTFDRSNVVEVTESAVVFKGPEVAEQEQAKINPAVSPEAGYSASASTISE